MSEVFSDNTIIHPLIKFADRPALTTDQIKEYWTKYSTANIALRTTSFLVVDIDTKKAHGKDGMKSIKQLPSGVILPTRTQKQQVVAIKRSTWKHQAAT